MTPSRACFGFALFSLIFSGSCFAQDAPDFYKGKTVRIVVGYSAGSSYDNYARLMARDFGHYLPGEPSVIVENMPGVSGLKAAQYLDNGAPTDGTVVAEVASDMVLEALFNPDQITTNFAKFSWIGSIDEDAQVCYMWHATGVKDWHQLVAKKPVILGSTGPGVASYADSRMLQAFLGVDVKQVRGYPGSAEKRIAIESGELDGDCTAWPGVPQDWLRDRKINLILRMSGGAVEGMPSALPYIGDLLVEPQQQQVFRLLSLPKAMGRPFLASGAIPAERREALRRAFEAMVSDPKFAAEAASMTLTIKPRKGEDVSQRVREIYQSPPELTALAKNIVD